MTYIIFVFLGIIIFFYFNIKEKLLIPFDVAEMNRCKASVCPITLDGHTYTQPGSVIPLETLEDFEAFWATTDTPMIEEDRRGDCAQQCIASYLNTDTVETHNLGLGPITEYMNSYSTSNSKTFFPYIDNKLGYVPTSVYNLGMPFYGISPDEIPLYMNPMENQIENASMALDNLAILFSELGPGTSRLLKVIRNTNKYTASPNISPSRAISFFYHVVIIARSNENIYLLDSKHRVIMKNQDIFLNPWFNIVFNYDEIESLIKGQESFFWNLDSSYSWNLEDREGYNKLIFFPVYDLDSLLRPGVGGARPRPENDVNPRWEAEVGTMRYLLTNGHENLTLEENASYEKWIRRGPNGIVIDPRKKYSCAAFDRVRYGTGADTPLDDGAGADTPLDDGAGADTPLDYGTVGLCENCDLADCMDGLECDEDSWSSTCEPIGEGKTCDVGCTDDAECHASLKCLSSRCQPR